MRNIFYIKYYVFFFVLTIFCVQCDDQEFNPVLNLEKAPEITSPSDGTEFVLLEDKVDEIISDFAWTAADFGFQAGIEYTLELDVAGNNFADPVILGAVNALSIEGLAVGKINGILITKLVPDGVPSGIEFRVCASVADAAPIQCSEIVTVQITPFKAEIDYPKLNVPGSYQGWVPEDFTTVIYSLNSDEVFEGYLYMGETNTQFKYAKGSWDTNWGDTGADGTLEPGGDNIVLEASEGMYYLKADLNSLTHQFNRTDWGLIGSATPTGWDADTDMIWDATKSALTLTLDLVKGAIKFRANDNWDLNYGDTAANGSLEPGGDDIIIADPGNYTIELDLDQPDFTYVITKN